MVEETEYRATYNSINTLRCVFEKALMTRKCRCSRARNFRLAEREGFGCNHTQAQQRCTELLTLMRNSARFTLGMPTVDGPLPHNKEIRVQVGGMCGLQALCGGQPADDTLVADIDAAIETCIARHGSLQDFPFDQVLPSIAAYEVKRWRGRRKPDAPSNEDDKD